MPAINFPSSPTIGQQYTDSNSRIWEYNGFAWEPYIGSSTREFTGAKVGITSALNLTSTNTAVSFSSEEYDTINFRSDDTPTKLIARKTGYYRINAKIFTGNNGSGNSYVLTVKKNGTTDVGTVSAGTNQGITFDEVIYLFENEYIELYAKENTASGTLTTDTIVEFTLVGTPTGTNAFNNANAFSGVKLKLSTVENLNGTNTAITWDSAEFNLNADPAGNNYWTISNSGNVKIYTTGYYRVQAYIQVGVGGTANSYNVNFKKNNTTNLTTAKLGPNDTLTFDETIVLNTNDSLLIEAAETSAAGTITTDSFFLVTRTGI